MHDILPEEAARWHFVEQTARDHFSLYGYSEIRTPILEETSLFQRSVGELTDIVKKEMYSFEDKGGDSLSLRPEGTAPVVRAAIEHNLININSPQLKVYYLGPMYRHERPQKGRFRQFYQIGAENFGSDSPMADAETITMLALYLKKAGVAGWSLKLNSLGNSEERKEFGKKLAAFFAKQKDQYCEDCRLRIERNPLRVLDCKNPQCIELSKGHPSIFDLLEKESLDHFESVKRALDGWSVSYTVDPMLVRGLDYYQRTVFEISSDKLGAQSAIAAGGRYDSLVADLGGPDIPGVGFAIGLERLLMLVPEKAGRIARKKIFIAFLGDPARQKAAEIARKLRLAGLYCEMDYEDKSLKSQMRRADKLGVTHLIIIGENEIKTGKAQVKDFATKLQKELPFTDLVTFFSKGS